MYAWRARDVLRLPQETVDLIADRISRCAHGPFFRFPNVRLNQINWNCELYAHLATVTGDPELLRNDYRAAGRALLRRASRGALTPGGSPNLGPGYRFHYLPHAPPTHPFNLDSAEYANKTCHFILYYEQALRAGMPPLAPEHMRLLRAWIEHIVYGYWTHGGYLNWDTGYGFKRWHAGPHLGARAAGPARDRDLAAVSQRPEPRAAGRSTCSTAASQLYERLSVAGAGRPRDRAGEPLRRQRRAARPEHPRDVRRPHAGQRRARGRARPRRPAGAPSRRRCTRSTPTSAGSRSPRRPTTPPCCAVNQHAVPYGGIELARLYDGDQRVVANVGGRPWASFGVLVRDASAQRGRCFSQRAAQPAAAASRRSSCSRRRADACAGEAVPAPALRRALQDDRRARPTAVLGGRVETTHRFKPDQSRRAGRSAARKRGRYTVDVLFPSWGKRARGSRPCSPTAARVTLAGQGRAAAQGPAAQRRLLLHRGRGERLRRGAGRRDRGTAHILRPKRQSSAPRPGPDARDAARASRPLPPNRPEGPHRPRRRPPSRRRPAKGLRPRARKRARK